MTWILFRANYLLNTTQHDVDWFSFAFNYVTALLLILGGFFYRKTMRSLRIASVLIGVGIFVGFTNAGATLNYLVGFDSRFNIDVWLSVLDAHLGFNWAAYVNWFEQRPILTYFLAIVYQSSLLQLAFVIIVLGFTGELNRLNDFFVVGVVASLISISIWSVWTSFGPALLSGSQELEDGIDLIIDASYLKHLSSVKNGVPLEINSKSLRGLIAFPSMHTVIMLMVLYYSRSSIFFPFLLIFNIGMPFSILLHGGHHLMDVIGGMAVFVFILIALKIRDFYLVS